MLLARLGLFPRLPRNRFALRHASLPDRTALPRATRFALPGLLLGTALAALLGLAALPPAGGQGSLVAQSGTSLATTDVPVMRGFEVLEKALVPPTQPVKKPAAAPKPVVKPSPKPTPTRAKKRVSRARSAAPVDPVEQTSTGGYACPVAGRRSFSDTWGEARSGGRRHEGTDVMAAYGTPLAAVTAGVMRTAFSGAGGISLYLDGDDGVEYFYAHNSRNSVSSGQRVRAGDLVGAVGSSGNAPKNAPHVHFERHPGGTPVNPYSFLRRIC